MIVEDSYPPVLRLAVTDYLDLEFERAYPYGPDDHDVSGLLVRSRGAHATVEAQVILLGGDDGLVTFLRSLYDDFRGWDGERTWTTCNRELSVGATHDGYTHLRWNLTHRLATDPVWTFSTVTHHGPEDIRRLCDAFTELLTD